MKMTTLPSQDSIICAPCRLALLLIAFALACFALAPQARAVCQEGCLTNENTVLGEDALISNTTGVENTKAVIAGIYGATVPGGIGVLIDSNGRLGTTTSSSRFKDEIKPMDKVSDAILALKQVTFRYKK